MYQSTSNQHIYMNVTQKVQLHTHPVTYMHKHSRLLLVVMVFCSTLRCNRPRQCSVGAISLL